ncbi:YD repeat-containing protein [Gillisia sp. Hel_I_86]|uniref:DUF6443 domain-containing protein n=1 Tax=Gillisia sp. Hel_I_86 TaxID=1249981 RepID=UPI00119C688F|nr:DUF6443 domain-containing protein [Gillisia sp. Hel_I_86]TVZ27852.1 YD repeat-containing protein [Gillisia sp. Hel_I_86]
MKSLLLFGSFIFFGSLVSAQTGTENYVQKKTYKKESSTALSGNTNVIEEITYLDGLGRTKQTIGVDQSPSLQDIVTFIGYDAYGRQDKQYLPVPDATGTAGSFKTGDIALKAKTYYKSNYGSDFLGTAATSNPYSETRFEDSPLNRAIEQGAPGDAWEINPTSDTDHSVKFEYKANTHNPASPTSSANDNVRLYNVSLNTVYTPTLNLQGYYTAGELYKSIVKNENWTSGVNNTTEEFKDKQGRVVLKRTYNASVPHDTYYVYDAYGNLTYVLPPKSEPQSAKPDATELSELCYQYKYDKRNRLVEKKIPGKNVEFIVYNKLDQPVLTQDANLKAQNKWLYTKYDAFGRVVSTGLFTNSSGSQAIMQAALDNHYNGTANKAWEEKTTTSTNNYYTNQSYPTSSIEVLTLNYYDNYTFNTAGLKLNAGTLVFDDNVEYTTKGLPTGSRVKVLGQTSWITSVMHYDDKGRVIYSASNNAFLGSTDKVKQDLDFIGNVLATEATHTKGSMNVVTLDNYTYDHVNRLLKHTQTLNGRTELIAENAYSETGELKSKKVGNIATSSSRLQTVDYTYNVRGWLKQINNPASLGSDLFGFKLNYNTAGHGATPLYNGNIAETEWKTQNDNVLRWYNYSYDNLNRLTAGTANSTNYNVSGITYDKNGNILTLTRRGQTNASASTFGNMDVLTYGYSSYSNKLLNVNDTGNTTYGFKDSSGATTQYTYDINGNLTSDANKGITSVLYNHLNMPTKITVTGADAGVLDYTYSADGIKLQKKKTVGANVTTMDYAGNFIYENNVLKQFYQPEGYVEPDGNGSYQYVYQYQDIWGNTRITYADDNNNGSVNSSEIRREQNYYPYGLEHKGYNGSSYGVKNNLKTYQGQEFTEDLGLNTHEWKYRMSDPSIGRFWQIDPLAEDYTYNSTYAFQENKMGMGTELEGAELLPHPWMVADAAANPNGVSAHAFGISNGLANTVTGTWNAVTNPGQTLKGMANMMIVGASQGNPSSMLALDNALGSDSFGTSAAMSQALDGAVNDVVNGNGFERGTVIGEVLGAVAVTKGTTTALKGLSTLNKLTTAEGFLLGGVNIKAPFNIPVQRFGLMKVDGVNHFSPQIGSSKLLNRTFNAIKPEFNSLDLFTKGIIPKGTPIKFGIVGPQSLKYPGGNIQILANPKNVLNQESKLINQ